jgi:ubiquinone/menaquinone biosynthesis C-methylase UbiE
MPPMGSSDTATLFDEWALNGRAEGMERGHEGRAVQALEAMPIVLDDKLLDLGCGNGWASRWLRKRTGRFGFVAGVDASAEMVRLAKQVSGARNSVQFRQALFEDLPWSDEFFHHAFSMEALYYAPDLGAALKSVARVLRPGGTLTVCTDFYQENPHCHGWQEMMGVTMHLLSQEQWVAALAKAGLSLDSAWRCYDSRPVDESKPAQERAAEEHFRTEVGSLALRATRG